jgi:hypothetical protein
VFLLLHWNIATADRNIANSLKGFAKSFFKFAKLMRKIPNEFGSQKRNGSCSLPVKPTSYKNREVTL